MAERHVHDHSQISLKSTTRRGRLYSASFRILAVGAAVHDWAPPAVALVGRQIGRSRLGPTSGDHQARSDDQGGRDQQGGADGERDRDRPLPAAPAPPIPEEIPHGVARSKHDPERRNFSVPIRACLDPHQPGRETLRAGGRMNQGGIKRRRPAVSCANGSRPCPGMRRLEAGRARQAAHRTRQSPRPAA
jgi:hypothetical protein